MTEDTPHETPAQGAPGNPQPEDPPRDTPPHGERTAPPALASPPGRRTQWIEIGIVLTLAFLPDMVRAIQGIAAVAAWRRWERLGYGDSVDWAEVYGSGGASGLIWLITRSLQVSIPLLYIVWITRGSWASLGLARPRPDLDLAVALPLTILAFIAYHAVAWPVGIVAELLDLDGTLLFHYPDMQTPRPALPGMLLLLMALTANSFAEELVMRGYLIPRLRALLGSAALAVLISSGLFAAYHLYQGIYGIVGAFTFGILAGASLIITGRLWPAIIAHTIGNIIIHIWLWQP